LAIAGVLFWVVTKRTTGIWRRVWIGVLAAWIVICIPVFWIVDSPYLGFEIATVQCGRQPAIATNFAAADSYEMPGDLDYGPSIFSSGYYCSAAEAEAAGYHRTVFRGS
jgi:hypothetical protein